MKNLTQEHQKSNYEINTMTIRQQLEQVLSGLTASEQLYELEKLSMKLRKANNLVIENKRKEFALKYPKVHEMSRKYTK